MRGVKPPLDRGPNQTAKPQSDLKWRSRSGTNGTNADFSSEGRQTALFLEEDLQTRCF